MLKYNNHTILLDTSNHVTWDMFKMKYWQENLLIWSIINTMKQSNLANCLDIEKTESMAGKVN